MNVKMLMPEEYRAAHALAIKRYLTTGVKTILGSQREVVAMRRDGSRFPIELVVSEVRVGAGRFFSGIIRDISERKRAEDTLRESEQRFHSMADNSPVMIYVDDALGNPEFLNTKALEFFGLTPEEIGHRPPVRRADFMDPACAEDGGAVLLKAVQERRPVQTELRMRRSDGQYRWLLSSGSPRFTPSGEFAGFIFSCTDITERKQTEELTLEIAKGVSAETGERFFHVIVEHLARMLGADVALIGRIVGPDTARISTLAIVIDSVSADNFVYDLECTPCSIAITNGECFYASDIQTLFPKDAYLVGLNLQGYVGVALRDSQGRPLGLLSVLFRRPIENGQMALSLLRIFAMRASAELERQRADESLRRSEEQLRQALKMEAIGHLAGGVAHDFNNLLSIIMGHTELALLRLSDDGPMRQSICSIDEAAQHAASLTRQLLTFSRRQALEPKIIDLNECVEDMEKMLRRVIGEEIEFVSDLVPGLGPVMADPGQIQQVIMNLVINARDAMPTGGRLTISTSSMDVTTPQGMESRALKQGQYIALVVRDTGCGMDELTKTRVFEPFFTTKELGKGTGLGLSMVYGIIQQSQGHLDVESALGQGTAFRIYLPRVDGTPESIRQETVSRDDHRGSETVLLVEDEDGVRDLVNNALTAVGYQVLTASGGEHALRIAAEQRGAIDLVITDMIMPGLSGPALVNLLHQQDPTIRVIFISGYTRDTVAFDGLPDEEYALIQKPFRMELLQKTVREVLDAPAPQHKHAESPDHSTG